MSGSMSVILVDADVSNRRDVAHVLGASAVTIAAQIESLDALPAMLARPGSPPRVVIVNLDPDPRDALRRLAPLIRHFPATSFFAMSRAAAAELVMDAMHLGVSEFIPLPLDRSRLVAGIEEFAEAGEGPARRATVVQFVPTIGGAGATTIACGVAATLARLGKTLIIDLDFARGAVANGFDVRPRQSIADVAGDSASLDSARLEAAVAVHRDTRLAVLARPEAPEDGSRVTGEGLDRLLDLASRAYDFVVLDSTMSLDAPHAAAARVADVTVPVMQLTVPSAKNTERYLHSLRRMGIDSARRARLVVNRFVPERSDIQPSEVERALGVTIAWTLPNDYATAMGAINFGEPVSTRAPRSELSKSIVGLAHTLAGRGEPTAPAEPNHQVRSPT